MLPLSHCGATGAAAGTGVETSATCVSPVNGARCAMSGVAERLPAGCESIRAATATRRGGDARFRLDGGHDAAGEVHGDQRRYFTTQAITPQVEARPRIGED